MDKEEFKAALNEVLDTRRSIDAERHREHHRFMDEWIAEIKRRRQTRERIKEQVIGWGAISTVGSVVGAIGYAAVQWIKSIKTGG